MTTDEPATSASKSPTRGRAAIRVVARVGLIAAGTLLAMEVGLRVWTGDASFENRDTRSAFGRLDPVMGHVPRAGLSARINDDFSVTTLRFGTRSNVWANVAAGNPHARPSAGPPTLVVGDSYAWGDGVHDAESWPAYLEQRWSGASGRAVVNAAVPGFGFGQMVSRAEVLAPHFKPDRIVISFIPHDIRRAEMSVWSGIVKPYFSISDGKLQHHGPPAPAALRSIAGLLSRSALVDRLFHERLASDGPDTRVHSNGPEVACALMQRLVALGDSLDAQVFVVAQPQTPLPNEPHYAGDRSERLQTDTEIVAQVLGCAGDLHLPTLDLIPIVAALPPEQRERLFRDGRHNSPEGNAFIADKIDAFLGGLELR